MSALDRDILRPGRLWSLWEMLRIHGDALIDSLNTLSSIDFVMERDSGWVLNDEGRRAFAVAKIDAMTEQLKGMQLNLTVKKADAIRVILTTPDLYAMPAAQATIGNHLKELKERLRDELETTALYCLPSSSVAYLEPREPLFGPQVNTGFPSAIYEIDEAGKCFALGRHTASVFHLMRVLEIGLEAVRKCLGIPDPLADAERNWGAILRKLNTELGARKVGAARSWSNADDKDFFFEIYALLDAVRNVWRNTTMHVEIKYVEDEADSIFRAVRSFMKKLASRLDESGQPLA